MGLPLLFKPISEHDSVLAGRPKNSPLPPRIAGFNNGVGSGAGAVNTGGGDVARKISDPGELPEFQDFKSAKVAGETFLTISCSEQFSAFSPEVCVYPISTLVVYPVLIQSASPFSKGITVLLA